MAELYKSFAAFRTGIFVLLTALIFIPCAALAADSTYTVTNVAVDVTATNAVEARERALEQGQQTAFRMLIERLLTPDQVIGFAMPDLDTISTLVQDFEVTNEQISPVRYKGVYTIRFRPEAVKMVLSQDGLVQVSPGPAAVDPAQPYIAQEDRAPVLILPFYQYGYKTMLWDPENPWMQAWGRAVGGRTAVPVVVPIGDLRDVALIRDDQALTYSRANMDQMLERYDATDAVILIAAPTNGTGALSVNAYDTRGARPVFLETFVVSASGNNGQILGPYDAAVQEVLKFMADMRPVQGAGGVMEATVRFASLSEWIAMKKALEAIPGMKSVSISGMKPREAQVKLEYSGNEATLAAALEQVGLGLMMPRPDAVGPYEIEPYSPNGPGNIEGGGQWQ